LILSFLARVSSHCSANSIVEIAELFGVIHVRLFEVPLNFPRHLNRVPLMSFGRTGMIETCTFHSCPDIRGCTGIYCTAS